MLLTDSSRFQTMTRGLCGEGQTKTSAFSVYSMYRIEEHRINKGGFEGGARTGNKGGDNASRERPGVDVAVTGGRGIIETGPNFDLNCCRREKRDNAGGIKCLYARVYNSVVYSERGEHRSVEKVGT